MTKSTALHDPLMPLTDEFLSDPYPTLARFRQEAPVFWSDKGKYWMVTRFAEVNEVLRDTHFEKNLQNWKQVPPLVKMVPPFSTALKLRASFVVNMDPPDHTRIRSLLNKAFTPSMIQRMTGHIQSIADDLIKQMQEKSSCDLLTDFAFPLPVTVIAEMLGVPSEDRMIFKNFSNEIAANMEFSLDLIKLAHGNKANEGLVEYLRPLVAERRKNPKDDLISVLVQAEEEGKKLTEDELLNNCVFLLLAGHETTVNLIGNGMLNLLRFPDQMQKLIENPDLIENAVHETLRFEGPVQAVRRLAGQDMELAGQKIKEDELLLLFLGSANRDPAEWENADKFDITRPYKKSLAFGQGIHYCLGVTLAETEGKIAIGSLVKSLKNIQLSGDLHWRSPFILRGLKSLPITYSV